MASRDGFRACVCQLAKLRPEPSGFFHQPVSGEKRAEANHSRPHESIKRLPAYLKELGYEVVSFGKVSHYAHVTEQGFDRAEHFGYHDHAGVQASVDFLKNRKSQKPLPCSLEQLADISSSRS